MRRMFFAITFLLGLVFQGHRAEAAEQIPLVSLKLPAWLVADIYEAAEKTLFGNSPAERADAALTPFLDGTYGLEFEGEEAVRVIGELGYGGLEAERAWRMGDRTPRNTLLRMEFYCTAAAFQAAAFFRMYRFANRENPWVKHPQLSSIVSDSLAAELDEQLQSNCLRMVDSLLESGIANELQPLYHHLGTVGWRHQSLEYSYRGFSAILKEVNADTLDHWMIVIISQYLLGDTNGAKAATAKVEKAVKVLKLEKSYNRKRLKEVEDAAADLQTDTEETAEQHTIRRAKVYANAGFRKAARRMLTTLHRNSGSREALFTLALVEKLEGDYRAVEKIAEELLEKYPKEQDSYRLAILNHVTLLDKEGLTAESSAPRQKRILQLLDEYRVYDAETAEALIFILNVLIKHPARRSYADVTAVYLPALLSFKHARADSTAALSMLQAAAAFHPNVEALLGELSRPLPASYEQARHLHVPLAEMYLALAAAANDERWLAGIRARLNQLLPGDAYRAHRQALTGTAFALLAWRRNDDGLRKEAIIQLHLAEQKDPFPESQLVTNNLAVLYAEMGKHPMSAKMLTEATEQAAAGFRNVINFNQTLLGILQSGTGERHVSQNRSVLYDAKFDKRLDPTVDAWNAYLSGHLHKRSDLYAIGSPEEGIRDIAQLGLYRFSLPPQINFAGADNLLDFRLSLSVPTYLLITPPHAPVETPPKERVQP